MLATEDNSRHAINASYAAYNDAVKAAYRALSDLIADYFDQHRELYNAQDLEVPANFRPLKEYERALKIQELTLRLAIRTAELGQHETLPIQSNGLGCLPVALAVPTTEGRL